MDTSAAEHSLALRSAKRDTACVRSQLATTLLVLLSACGFDGGAQSS